MDILSEHSSLARWGDAIDEDDSHHAPVAAGGSSARPTAAEAAELDALACESRQGLNLMFKQVRRIGMLPPLLVTAAPAPPASPHPAARFRAPRFPARKTRANRRLPPPPPLPPAPPPIRRP